MSVIPGPYDNLTNGDLLFLYKTGEGTALLEELKRRLELQIKWIKDELEK